MFMTITKISKNHIGIWMFPIASGNGVFVFVCDIFLCLACIRYDFSPDDDMDTNKPSVCRP